MRISEFPFSLRLFSPATAISLALLLRLARLLAAPKGRCAPRLEFVDLQSSASSSWFLFILDCRSCLHRMGEKKKFHKRSVAQRFGIGGRRSLVGPVTSREQKKPDECNPFDEGVRVPKTRWKHHKSKDLTFLHRSYTQLSFSTPKTNIFCSIEKK